MSEPSVPDPRREKDHARLEAGYRQPIGDAVERLDRAEREAEMARRMAELERSLSGTRDLPPLPGWMVAIRVGVVVLVWAGLAALGAWLFGVWGGVGGLALPVVLFFAYALLGHYGGMLIDGKGEPVGELRVELDGNVNVVKFVWTGARDALSLALLAQLDRKGWELDWRSRVALMVKARLAAEARLQGAPERSSEWSAAPGRRGDPSVSLVRYRTGVAYSTSHGFSLTDPGPSPTTEVDATLAIVDYGLCLPDGERFARAVVEVATAYEKGRENARKVVRKYAKDLAAG